MNDRARCRQTAPPRSRQRRLISTGETGTFPPSPGGAELALSPPLPVGLNWHFPPLSGSGKPPADSSEANASTASRPPQARRRCRRRSPGPRLAQTRRQRVRSGRESGRNSPEHLISLSKTQEPDPTQPLREDWHFPPSLPWFSSRLRSRSWTVWRTHGNSRTICPTRCLVRPYLAPTWAWAASRATQAAISTLRFQRSCAPPCQRFTARRDCAVVEVSSHHDRFRYRGADRQARPRTAALGWASTTAATMRARQSHVVLSEDLPTRQAAAERSGCLAVVFSRSDGVDFLCIRQS